jgi:hypothetical protein
MNNSDEISIEKITEFCEHGYTGARAMDDVIAMYAYGFALAWIKNGLHEREFLYRLIYTDKNGSDQTEIHETLEVAEVSRDFLAKDGCTDFEIETILKNETHNEFIEWLDREIKQAEITANESETGLKEFTKAIERHNAFQKAKEKFIELEGYNK